MENMLTRRTMLRSAAAFAALPQFSNMALARSQWPAREIRAVCGFPPGSGADALARFYARKLQETLGATVILDNKVGAFGNIASEYVAKAKPDGYTILIAPGFSTLAAAPSLYKSLPFDPVKDFDHVTTLSKVAFILIVAGDSSYKSVADLTSYLQAKGDKASYGSVSNTGLAASELYKACFNLPTVEVKYKDPSAMLQDLYGGNIVFSHFDPIQAAGPLKEGKLRALAISAKDRFVSLPDIPSASEAGIKNCDIVAWWSVHAPKGTSSTTIEKLETLFNQIVIGDDHRKFLTPIGSDPFPGSSAKLQELLNKDIEAWREYVKIGHISPI
jgi:tripartite-type tricarboxylate transporter receptor subunit TctC